MNGVGKQNMSGNLADNDTLNEVGWFSFFVTGPTSYNTSYDSPYKAKSGEVKEHLKSSKSLSNVMLT